jgi:hypothetical protein
MTLAISSSLDAFKTAAEQAEASERQYRREAAQQIAALERRRAFAFRRLNLIRAIADAVANSEDEEIAVARALAVLRTKLGWTADSEARTQTLARFAPIGRAVFHGLAPSEDVPVTSVQSALAEFETWYADNHETPFWVLFERYVPETPLVDF